MGHRLLGASPGSGRPSTNPSRAAWPPTQDRRQTAARGEGGSEVSPQGQPPGCPHSGRDHLARRRASDAGTDPANRQASSPLTSTCTVSRTCASNDAGSGRGRPRWPRHRSPSWASISKPSSRPTEGSLGTNTMFGNLLLPARPMTEQRGRLCLEGDVPVPFENPPDGGD